MARTTNSASVGRLFSPRLVIGAAALVMAAGAAHSAATRAQAPRVAAATQAEALYPDAPDGVDPVVTGPVSVSFKQRQADAGCDKAVWPNVPTACYPD